MKLLRNYEKRHDLLDEIRRLEKEREIVCGTIEDEDEEERIWDKYSDQIFRLNSTMKALEYPESRNKWFNDIFVESFGFCESKRISIKQANIFIKYSEPSHEFESGRGTTYYCRSGNKFIRIMEFSGKYPAYFVTIKNIDQGGKQDEIH